MNFKAKIKYLAFLSASAFEHYCYASKAAQ
jgi:hypothetical protein